MEAQFWPPVTTERLHWLWSVHFETQGYHVRSCDRYQPWSLQLVDANGAQWKEEREISTLLRGNSGCKGLGFCWGRFNFSHWFDTSWPPCTGRVACPGSHPSLASRTGASFCRCSGNVPKMFFQAVLFIWHNWVKSQDLYSRGGCARIDTGTATSYQGSEWS